MTTRYVGAHFEIEDRGGLTIYRHHIRAGGQTVAQYERRSDGANPVHYQHRDHQGSVVATTDVAGAIHQRWEYEAFGYRWLTAGSPPDDTERGFTGHEHLDSVDLIHMNGRLLDPVIGRQISADPYIQDPFFTESFNRYSYVWNNPMSRVDPSGFQSLDDDLPIHWRAQAFEDFNTDWGALWVQSVSYHDSIPGPVRDVLAVSPVIYGEPPVTVSAPPAPRNGVVFRPDGAVRNATPLPPTDQGRFIPAVAPVFQPGGQLDEQRLRAAQRGVREAISRLRAQGVLETGRTFDSPDAAAIAVLEVVVPLGAQFGIEIGGNIVVRSVGNTVRYQISVPQPGNEVSVHVDTSDIGYHTHPGGLILFSNFFSSAGGPFENDIKWVQESGKALYVGTELGDGKIAIAVCEPGDCRNRGISGTSGRRIQ